MNPPSSEKKLAELYRQLFFNEVGKTILADLWSKLGGASCAFNPDPMTMAYQEGQRNALLYILSQAGLVGLPQFEFEEEQS